MSQRPVPSSPPFRDLLLEGETAPPFPALAPPVEQPAPKRTSLLDRWNGLPRSFRRFLQLTGFLGLAAVLLLLPEAKSMEVVRVEAEQKPSTLRTEIQPRPVPTPVEVPLPSWYVSVKELPLGCQINSENASNHFRLQQGKPVPPNAITNLQSVLGKYTARTIGANTNITPQDFTTNPVELFFVTVSTSKGITAHPYLKLPNGELQKLHPDDPVLKTPDAIRQAREVLAHGAK